MKGQHVEENGVVMEAEGGHWNVTLEPSDIARSLWGLVKETRCRSLELGVSSF